MIGSTWSWGILFSYQHIRCTDVRNGQSTGRTVLRESLPDGRISDVSTVPREEKFNTLVDGYGDVKCVVGSSCWNQRRSNDGLGQLDGTVRDVQKTHPRKGLEAQGGGLRVTPSSFAKNKL